MFLKGTRRPPLSSSSFSSFSSSSATETLPRSNSSGKSGSLNGQQNQSQWIRRPDKELALFWFRRAAVQVYFHVMFHGCFFFGSSLRFLR
jgi:hypothetical protein